MNRMPCLILLVLLAAAPGATAQLEDLIITAGNQSVKVPSDPALIPPNGLTIEAWIYYDPSLPWTNSYPTIVRKSNTAHSYILRVAESSDLLQFGVATTNGGYTGFDSTATVPSQVWTHVAATWDGSLMQIYKDGQPVGSKPKTGTMTGNTQDLKLGGGFSSLEPWCGRIDELRIWDHARSQAEINGTMFTQLDGQPGLIAAWHFNGNLFDFTGGFDGIPEGGVATTASTSPVASLRVLAPGAAVIGTPVNFEIRGADPNAPYFFDNSFSGTSVGTPLIAPLNGTFPLDSPLLNLTYGPAAPGIFVGYMGYTDAQGSASATFNLPPFPNLAGMNLYSACLYLDSLSPMVLGDISAITTTLIQMSSIPSITAIIPSTGPISGSWPVAIAGDSFQPDATVLFGGLPATNVVVHNSQLITCDTPAGVLLGSVNVQVHNGDGSSAQLISGYSYRPDLTLVQVTPVAANAGQTVTATGDGISTNATITLGGQVVTPTSITPTQFSFIMPAGVACHASLAVSNPDGQSAGLVMNPGPYISATQGTTGPYTGGTIVKLFGNHFSPQAQVSFDGNAGVVLLATTSYVEVLSPPGLPGPAAVVLTNPDGCTATTSFNYGL